MKTNNSKNTSNSKSTRGPGAPPKLIKFPRGAFTIAEVVELNPHVCELSVRNRVNTGLASKTLIRLAENLETEQVGRPSFRFMTKAASAASRSARKSARTRKATPAPVTATTVTVADLSPDPEATQVLEQAVV